MMKGMAQIVLYELNRKTCKLLKSLKSSPIDQEIRRGFGYRCVCVCAVLCVFCIGPAHYS